MNNYNSLLQALDKVFGHPNKSSSTFKPVNKYFDPKTGELITVIEYRTKKQGEVIIQNKTSTIEKKHQRLLQAILQQKNSEPKK